AASAGEPSREQLEDGGPARRAVAERGGEHGQFVAVGEERGAHPLSVSACRIGNTGGGAGSCRPPTRGTQKEPRMAQADQLQRLANAILWPGFLGSEVPGWLADALDDGLAGVVYFAQNLDGDTAALSEEIHRIAPQALIGIDEEGGSVTRLETSTGSSIPGAAQLGMLDDPDLTRATGYEVGRRVAAIGGDVVIAPVADVNTGPRNPVIGVRAFGASTDLVSRHVAAAVRGIQATGVAACAKHYPGHGDTHTDSHHDLPRLTLSQDEIERVHLPPFQAAVDAGVLSIMTDHITATK